MTERPRLHFPPMVLCLRDFVGGVSLEAREDA